MKQTKKCTKCGITKPINEFSKAISRKDGHNVYCKVCNKSYRDVNKEIIAKRDKEYYSKTKDVRNAKLRQEYSELKQQLVDYKGGKCSVCGYNKCLRALTFHHCKDKKKFEIGTAMARRTYTIEQLKEEADKCILVCFNCHMEIHK